MRLNPQLNFVIPVEQEGGVLHVHATPISSEVFDRYWKPISLTFTEIYSSGLGLLGAPRVAKRILRDVSVGLGAWEGPQGVEAGLMAEIRRLANLVDLRGEIVPFQEALDRRLIDQDDVDQVENALVFFTVASLMHLKQELAGVLKGAAELWGAQVSSSSITEWRDSWRTSTTDASTGGTPTREPAREEGSPIPH